MLKDDCYSFNFNTSFFYSCLMPKIGACFRFSFIAMLRLKAYFIYLMIASVMKRNETKIISFVKYDVIGKCADISFFLFCQTTLFNL